MGNRPPRPVLPPGEGPLGVAADLEVALLDGTAASSLSKVGEGGSYGSDRSDTSTEFVPTVSANSTDRGGSPNSVLPATAFSGVGGGAPDVAGEHNLTSDELDAVLKLRDVQEASAISLHKPQGTSARACSSQIYFLTPLNPCGDSVAPSIIKVKSAAAAEREARAIEESSCLFGHYSMRLLEHLTDGETGVLQLEISGSKFCLPRFTRTLEMTKQYGVLFQQAVSDAESDEAPFRRVLQMAQELFVMILQPCTLGTLQDADCNLMSSSTSDLKTRLLGTRAKTKFGVQYVDGKVVLSNFGGVLSDEGGTLGADMLQKLVERATGVAQLPSSFFSGFFSVMEASRSSNLRLRGLQGIVHNDLHFGNILVDADNRVWLLDLETVTSGHVFTDLAKGWACGMFAYAGDIPSEAEEEHLRNLMLLWASIPTNIIEAFLPPPPQSCCQSTARTWAFATQMQRHFASYLLEARQDALAQPHVQLLWSLFDAAVHMVTDKQNAQHPRRKRLALFFCLAAAARLQYEVAGEARPHWLLLFQARWGRESSNGNAYSSTSMDGLVEAAFERYAATVQASEAWVRDPFTFQRFDVMKDMMSMRLSYGEVCFERAGPSELCSLMRERSQVLVIGHAGVGKTILTKQVVSHLMLDSNTKEGSRLPLRIPLLRLKSYVGLPGSSDLLQSYLLHEYHECEMKLISKARLEPGLVLILDGLDEADPERRWVLQWLSRLRAQEERHWVMVTSRPAALAGERNPGTADENDCLVSQLKRQRTRLRNRAAFGRSYSMEQIKSNYIMCEISGFSLEQVQGLASSRLGPETANIITPMLLQPCYQGLVSVPLLTTMLMHMLSRTTALGQSPVQDGSTAVASMCDVYHFTFTQLLRHADSKTSMMEGSPHLRPGHTKQSCKKWAGPEAEELIMHIAYTKQSKRCHGITAADFGKSESGRAMWRAVEQGQCALFTSCGEEEVKFFHLSMQEYLAAAQTLKLLEAGAAFPGWLATNNVFTLGVYRFLGELAFRSGFPFTKQQAWAFQCPNSSSSRASPKKAVTTLLEGAVAHNDCFGIAGLCNLLSKAKVTSMSIDLSGQSIASTKLLAKGLAEMEDLDTLSVRFDWCTHLRSCKGLGLAFSSMRELKSLQLVFNGCLNLKSLDDVFIGLEPLTKLRSVDVRMRHCRSISSVNELGKALAGMQDLSSLQLECKNCTQLSDIDEVWKSLATRKQLTTMNLDFTGCVAINCAEGLSEALGSQRFLANLVVRLNGTTMIENVAGVCDAIGSLWGLRHLIIDQKIRKEYVSLASTQKRRRTARVCVLWASLLWEFLAKSKVILILLCNVLWLCCLTILHHS